MTTNDERPDAHDDQDARPDGESTEVLDRTDPTRALEVEPQEPRRHGVADLLDEDEERDTRAASSAPASAPLRGTATPDTPPGPPAAGPTAPTAPTPAAPPAPKGPHVPAILLGIVCVAVAGLVLAQELGDLTVDWGDIGPLGIALTGGVLVVFGLLGLATSRRKGA